MEKTLLYRLGLHETQAKLYETMLTTGPITPAQLAIVSGEKRTTVYMALERLEAIGLVEQTKDTSSIYRVKNPIVLRSLLLKQQEELKKSNKELQAALPFMVSKYNLNYNQPGMLHLEGAQAVEQLYADIIRRKQEVLIFPSIHDHNDPEIAALISEQIKKQFKADIKVRVLYSEVDKISKDERLVLSRKGVNIRKFGVKPMHQAQIMIYGDTVAITTFSKGVYTTIMNSIDVASSMRAMFENMWIQAVN